MKICFLGISCIVYLEASAQLPVTKVYPTQAGQHINLVFDYPVVRVSTWEKNEVSVTSRVNINDHENDSAFSLEEQTENGKLTLTDHIKDLHQLPRRYTVVRNGQKTTFKSKEDYLKAAKENGVEKSYEALDIDIAVEIKVPANAVLDIRSVYGLVELTEFNTPSTIDATYGGIDARLVAARTGKIQATTHYGEISSDLELTSHEESKFFKSVTAEPGKGPAYSFTSNYGKIYLRKEKD